jgi:hypothetical protein
MSLEWKIAWSIATVSWLLSLYLLYRLWRGKQFLALKVGLSVLLVVPVLGPFFHAWILGFPEPMPGHLREEDPDVTQLSTLWSKDSPKRRSTHKKQ